jgi:alkylation response protein AidB-like acyl-CoA dehydrogenase
MDFGLSEEQQLLQETIRGFVENECPLARLREIFDGDSDYNPALWQGLVEMGVAGLTVPEQYGGAEMELLDLALVAEILGAGAVPSPFFGHSLAAIAISLGGDAAQKQRWLPGIAAGETIATIALGEAGEAWDPSGWQAEVVGGRLSGTKTYVTSAEVATWIVVGIAGGGFAVVARDTAGVKIEPIDSADRTRRSASVTFENAAAEVIAAPVADRVRDAGLILLAADALGGAWRLIEMSTDYAKAREQFGKKIAEFQAVKHQLANMAIEVEPGRALLWFAAHAFDHVQDQAELAAAMAKSHLTDRYTQVSRDAVEIYGGIGLTWECEVQMWLKRGLFDRAYLGLPQVHRERAARLSGW